ncbi:MAG: UvrD-helicase domain-containing protein [Bacteroidales bacterium]|nr:UvrD-helicase domain-containing protein [Bacteroidales bacterium]
MNPASDIKPFIISSASAGSGKTFTLVREYLRFALSGDEGRIKDNFRHILAITFTNKAANEMKTKIMDSLDLLAARGCEGRGDSLGAQLLQALNQMDCHRTRPLAEGDLMRRAAMLRTAILHRYSDLAVSTIDSFMHRVVRTFAHDLGRPVNFEVRIEQDDLVEQAVSSLMSLVGTEGHDDLTRAVSAFAVSRMEEGKGFAIEGSLATLASQLFAENAGQYLALLRDCTLSDFIDIYRRYTESNRRFEQQLKSLGARALELLASAGMDESVCNQGGRGYLSFFNKLAQGAVSQPNSYAIKVFEAQDYCGATLCKAKAYTPAADAVAQPLREVYFEAQRLLEEQLVDYNTRTLLLANLYSVALLGELERCLREYSDTNEVMHLSEFNKLINSVVLEQDAPFLYERLGNRYSHFLIDEFQDTSVLQWQNLVPLLANGVSQNSESLVVGDAKQAIYRFRQGDVRQFIRLPKVEGMPQHSRTLSRARFEPLFTSQRSLRAIVDFNNRFFSHVVRKHFADNALARESYIGPSLDVQPEGERLFQRVAPRHADGPEGFVGIDFVETSDPEAIPAQVLSIIADLVENHGFSYRDIMVLGRTRRELAAVGAYLLEHSEVPQSSAESFYLRGSHAVMALVAALRCLADPADRVSAADLMLRLQRLGVLRAGHLDAFLEGQGFDLVAVLRAEGMDFNPDVLLSLDLYDCCEQLLRLLRLDGVDTPYVASLLNRAAAFSARHMQSIGDFLRWFDDHPDLSAACSDEGDAVRLLTIHKAKGLDAPVVICPFFTPRPKPYRLWVKVDQSLPSDGKSLPAAFVTLGRDSSTRFDSERDREREETEFDDLNILYVALTRPSERFHAVCAKPNGDALTYSALLAGYLTADGTPLQEHYGFGNPDSPRKEGGRKEERAEDVRIDRLSYPEWTSVVRVASPSERALTPLLDGHQRFGIYAHELLSDIQHADDLEPAIRRFVKRQPTGIFDADLERLQALARDVVSNPLSERFFRAGYQVKNECAIVNGDTECRPDRVVIAPGETWVVDFKTGRDLGEVHDRQVQLYCRTLEAMGYPQVSGWLIYVDSTVTVRAVPRG